MVAFNDDISGSHAQEWQRGKSTEYWSSNDDDFYRKFYERGIAAPSSWMSVLDGAYAFMSETPAVIERVDFVGIAEGEKKEPAPAAPAKKSAKAPEKSMTGEDLLRQFAQAIGAPISKKGTKKRSSK